MKSDRITPLKPSTLSQGVFEQLCDLIRSGHFRSGDRLPSEKELCELFRVSRTTVRSGLQSLNALGLIESRDGSGAFVTKRSSESVGDILGVVLFHGIEDIEEIYEGRRVIESWAAYLAATRATEEELQRLEMLVDKQCEEVREAKSGIDVDFQFHLQIGTSARNEVVLRILHSMITLIFKVLDPSKRPARDLTMAVEQHRGILEALRRREAVSAMSRMWEHVSSGIPNGEATSFPELAQGR
jgi:GntR family transcriptional repressor for pyruvate dehydrogenase complex